MHTEHQWLCRYMITQSRFQVSICILALKSEVARLVMRNVQSKETTNMHKHVFLLKLNTDCTPLLSMPSTNMYQPQQEKAGRHQSRFLWPESGRCEEQPPQTRCLSGGSAKTGSFGFLLHFNLWLEIVVAPLMDTNVWLLNENSQTCWLNFGLWALCFATQSWEWMQHHCVLYHTIRLGADSWCKLHSCGLRYCLHLCLCWIYTYCVHSKCMCHANVPTPHSVGMLFVDTMMRFCDDSDDLFFTHLSPKGSLHVAELSADPDLRPCQQSVLRPAKSKNQHQLTASGLDGANVTDGLIICH